MTEHVRVQEKNYRYAFDWTPDEYLKAVRAVTKYQHRSGIGRLLSVVVPWGLAVANLGALVFAIRGSAYALALLPWLVLLTIIALVTQGGAAWLAARQYPKKGRGRLEVWITGEVIGSSSPLARLETPWGSIERVVEDDNFLLYYFTKRFASFVPKRLIDPIDLDELREMAQKMSRYERV